MSDIAADLFDTAPPAPRRSLAALAKGSAMAAASALLMPAMRRIAPDHIGGESLDDAWAVALRLRDQGLGHTLGFWDTPADRPTEVAAIYHAAIQRTAGSGGYVSIKPPALRFDDALARELAQAAAAAGVRLHCDSHGTNVADQTLAFAERLAAGGLPTHLVSISIPGRWARSTGDAARMLDRGIGVRIVKGEWPDPADPARDLREGYLAVVAAVARATARIALATHDRTLLADALARLVGTGAEVEAEAIFGLHNDLLTNTARAAGAPTRIYVPYGRGFTPNVLKALRRQPSLALDVVKHLVGRRP